MPKNSEKYLTKLASEKYRKAIDYLRNFQAEENTRYKINYRKDNQRKDSIEPFKSVVYVEETESFLFDDKLQVKIEDVNEVIVKEKQVGYAEKLLEGINNQR